VALFTKFSSLRVKNMRIHGSVSVAGVKARVAAIRAIRFARSHFSSQILVTE
jgi:hypothetical protein